MAAGIILLTSCPGNRLDAIRASPDVDGALQTDDGVRPACGGGVAALGVLGKTRGPGYDTAAWFWWFSPAAWTGRGRRWWAVLLPRRGGWNEITAARRAEKATGQNDSAQPGRHRLGPFRETFEQARNGGVPVFVDFTAEWCPNCKANEKFVLNTTSVAAAFKAKRVVTLVADWTDFDPTITKWLKSFERIGVPVYVLYYGDGSEPIVLSEFLTQRSLLEQLARIQS
jgi:thiol:disulfide interchange protein